MIGGKEGSQSCHSWMTFQHYIERVQESRRRKIIKREGKRRRNERRRKKTRTHKKYAEETAKLIFKIVHD